MHDQALILFAHGSRDPAWAEPLQRVCAAIRGRRPGLRVELAFLELMSPSLVEAIDGLVAQGVIDVTVVPAFMAQGGHVKRDLPQILAAAQQRHPQLIFRILPAMGESEIVIGAIADYAVMGLDGV